MLSLKKKMLMASGPVIRPQDVFSAALHTGNGGTQNVNNGLDVLGKGGIAWIKSRSNGVGHAIFDTARGPNRRLDSSQGLGEDVNAGYLTNFRNSGFSLGSNSAVNADGLTYVAWTFLKARGFFDVFRFTGNGQSGRQIVHNLKASIGLVVVKRLDQFDDWVARHRSAQGDLFLSRSDSQSSGFAYITAITQEYFTVSSLANQSSGEYVAIAFAQNPKLIQNISFVTSGTGVASVNHGWSNGAQFALIKPVNSAGDWEIYDRARSPNWTNDYRLIANQPSAEDSVVRISDSGGVTNLIGLPANTTFVITLIRSPT